MPTTRIKCRCHLGYQCSAPLHGEIEIITCEKNCGLGCDNGSGKEKKKQ